MSLVKTSFLNGIAVAVKVSTAVVLNKILAVYVGPSGYAVMGQLQNALAIASSLAGGAILSGVTKATAQHFDDEARQRSVWQTAAKLSVAVTVVVCAFLLLAGPLLSERLLQRADMSGVFVWLSLALPAIAANNLLLAIVNGKKEVGIYVAANIIGSLLSLALIGSLTFALGLYGALLAMTISPGVLLFGTGALLSRRSWFKARFLWGKVDLGVLRELSGFGLMGLTSALAAPFAHIFIRDHLSTSLGLDSAGYWQASWRISETYLLLVTATLSVYYLPRLAEIKTATDLRREVLGVYRVVMPIVIAGACLLYVLRDIVIHTLLSAAFAPARELFLWQLTGDVIKIGSWILSFIMLGRAMVKPFVLTELAFSLSFYVFTRGLTERFGLPGVSMAYTLNYSIYWVAMGYLIRNEMRKMEPASQSTEGR
jgi:polysaccharide transporter, PST family